jgi:hypothetical protein
MLGRHLPFNSQDENEIGLLTVKKEISFDHQVWNQTSEEAKDLMRKMLTKDLRKRIIIN